MKEIKKIQLSTEAESEIAGFLGTMLNYPRITKAEILLKSTSKEAIATIDYLQEKYYPMG